MEVISNYPRTCALCRHCSIDLGSGNYSDATPGSSGSVDCSKGHKEIDAEEGGVDLILLARVAGTCPDFELLALPREVRPPYPKHRCANDPRESIAHVGRCGPGPDSCCPTPGPGIVDWPTK